MTQPLSMCGRAVEILSANKKGDGTHRVLKVNDNGTPVVLKCYGRTRSRIEAALKFFGVRLVVGKTATSARARQATERTVLGLLKQQGFSVPEILSPEWIKSIRQPCLALSWIPGRSLAEVVRSDRYSLETKNDLLARCGAEMRQRHDRAVALRDPRLVFEHPSLHHVIVSEDRLVYTDFEITYCYGGDIERLARREAAGFVYSLARANWALFQPLFASFFEGYGNAARLRAMIKELRRYGTVPVAGWAALFPIIFRMTRRHRRIAAAARSLRVPAHSSAA